MINSRRFQNVAAAVVVLVLLTASAHAQTVEDRRQMSEELVELLSGRSAAVAGAAPAQSLVKLRPAVRPSVIPLSSPVGLERQTAPVPQTSTTRKQRSVRRKILGALAGATGGFFAGGFLGAKIEGNRCDCDDPGLMGFLVGAPIGAVTGGILGYKFLF
jgi:hypothetical protein